MSSETHFTQLFLENKVKFTNKWQCWSDLKSRSAAEVVFVQSCAAGKCLGASCWLASDTFRTKFWVFGTSACVWPTQPPPNSDVTRSLNSRTRGGTTVSNLKHWAIDQAAAFAALGVMTSYNVMFLRRRVLPFVCVHPYLLLMSHYTCTFKYGWQRQYLLHLCEITLIKDKMLTLVRHKWIFKRQALPSQWNGALPISQYCY